MLDWALLNLQDPNFIANIGSPPPPIASTAYGTKPYYSQLDTDRVYRIKKGDECLQATDLSTKPRRQPPDDGVPANHVLPAAYAMWRDVARLVSERASRWHDAEFQYRKERASIMCAIQVEHLHKALLETALDEIHRQDELLEINRMALKKQQ